MFASSRAVEGLMSFSLTHHEMEVPKGFSWVIKTLFSQL